MSRWVPTWDQWRSYVMKYGVKDKRKIKKQCTKCGSEFAPAGLAYHIKFCTGPGYQSKGTHSVPGRHDALANRPKSTLKKSDRRKTVSPCKKGCGRSYSAAGLVQHERSCTGKGYVPGYSAKRRLERNISNPSPSFRVKSTKETTNYWYAPQAAVRTAYEWFQFDSALFNAVTHL